MNAQELYEKLDHDFKIDDIGEEKWDVSDIQNFVTPSFVARSEGLMLDNTHKIHNVYTVTFPDKQSLQHILGTHEDHALIFSHHAQSWVFRPDGLCTENLPEDVLVAMRDRHIALYSLHIPLDHYSPYSTGYTFANTTDITIEKGCCRYLNAVTGIIGRVGYRTVADYAAFLETVIGHAVTVYPYGDDDIAHSKVGLVPGYGNAEEVLEEMHHERVNTFITGVSSPSEAYHDLVQAHAYAQQHRINIIGTTHYSSEKYALMAMTGYFEKMGLHAEFIEGTPNFGDL